MKNQLTLLNYIIISLLLVGVLIANILFLHSPILGLIFGLFYLIFYGWILGVILFPEKERFFQALYGPLFLLSGVSLAGAIIYYIWQLNILVTILLLIAIPLFLMAYIKKLQITNYKLQINSKSQILNPKFLLTTGYLIFVLIVFYLLFTSQTTNAIRSPWDAVPWYFFVCYLLATFFLLGHISQRLGGFNLILIIIHFILSFSVAWIVYPIGYGFDSFIHQATEKVIALQGFISPKPFYYIGQYSLVVFLSKLLQISVIWVDKLLLPVLAAVYLPTAIYYGFKRLTNSLSLFLIFYFLFLIFDIFIVTTPQGLANLFTLIILFLAIPHPNNKSNSFHLIFLGLTTVFIHPLAGIPVLIFLSILLSKKILQKFSLIIRGLGAGLIMVLSSIALPIVFLISSYFSADIDIGFNQNNLWKLPANFQWLDFYWQNKFNLINNLIYFYGHNLTFWFLTVTAVGAIVLWRKKIIKPWLPYLTTFAVLLINYLILRGLFNFQFLIEYEQNNYANRLWEISSYFLIPLFLYSLYIFTQKIFQHQKARLIWLIFIACLITASLYFTYPKNDDNYEVSHAFNVSTSDIKAVRLIAETAGNKDYIVLANQSVSAAAVREFGFKKYYQVQEAKASTPNTAQEAKASTPNTVFRETSIFYYPIPTSSPLYQYYLEMVYKKASRETMREAMDLVNVKEAYFVVNDYWWAWPRIVEQAKASADSLVTIDNGKIWIFKYLK